MRKIRTKAKTKVVEEVQGKALPKKSTTVKEILEGLRSGTEGILDDQDMEMLTDYGTAADALSKELEKDIKLIKPAVMAYAKHNKVKKMFNIGGGGFSIGAKTDTTYGGVTELAKLLKKYDKLKMFDDMASVKVGEVKKYLGEATLELEGFMSKKSEPYGTVSLKPKK